MGMALGIYYLIQVEIFHWHTKLGAWSYLRICCCSYQFSWALWVSWYLSSCNWIRHTVKASRSSVRVQLVRSHFLEPLLAPLIKWMKLQARGLNKGMPCIHLMCHKIPNVMGNMGILTKVLGISINIYIWCVYLRSSVRTKWGELYNHLRFVSSDPTERLHLHNLHNKARVCFHVFMLLNKLLKPFLVDWLWNSNQSYGPKYQL